MEIIAESRYRLVIPRHRRMRAPGLFAMSALIPDPAADRALEQVVNVAELRGIVDHADDQQVGQALDGGADDPERDGRDDWQREQDHLAPPDLPRAS